MSRKVKFEDILSSWDYTTVATDLFGGKTASQKTNREALYSQMPPLHVGRRILLTAGLMGNAEFLVIDGTNPHNASKVYPNSNASRIMAYTKVRLTPGYNIKASGIFVPSGPCQTSTSSGGFYEESQNVGYVEILITINNGISTASGTINLMLPASNETYKAIKSGSGGAWTVMIKQEGVCSIPEIGTIGWVENVTAELTIKAWGGARPVDICVYEIPNIAIHDETHRECTIPAYLKDVTSKFAMTGKEYTGNARGGSHQLSKTMIDYKKVCGPTIFQWSPWNEFVNTISQTEGTAVTSTSTTYADITNSTTSTWSITNPAWSMSCGSYGGNIEQSGPIEIENNSCVPVLCRAYMKGGGVGVTGTVKFQTADYSLCELSTTSATYVWVEKLAWLRCATDVQYISSIQVFLKSSSIATSCGIKYAAVEYYGNYVVTQ